ncbi:hypothetical protein BMF94_4703 [Rhodotorula taiwanensis]|uniref:C2H2-type domain-containing protein n=1 Tax=Rhodotorula taiwanensis TaxID=741276 RepID=A0A2S5B672_9BASI|nr:hypothetical protein BMF94_4703 [Rhodotorula taiwanensis]
MFTPLDEGRDSFGDGGALYGSHVYEPQQQQQRGTDDMNLAAYRRFSTPSLGYPPSAGGGDGGLDSRASNRPFRWSADFTQYDNAGGAFAPPAPPQHPLYQPQYLQSANPYHQPVSYPHGGTYQHPAYSRPSTADSQQHQLQQQHYMQQQQQQQAQQAPATYTLPIQRQHQQQPAPPLISFAPPPPPGAAETGSAGAPSLSLDTSHDALSAAAKFVSPPSATVSLPPQRPGQGQAQNSRGGATATSPWSGPPPPLSLSLGVSASSLAARRRNTTDFTTLSQSLPASRNGVVEEGDASAGRPGGDRVRVASADGTYSLGAGAGAGGGPGGKPLSATTSSSRLSATGSSGPTSATSAHPSGSHSGASSAGGVPTLSSIKEPRPSSPRSDAAGGEDLDGGDEDAEGEQDVEDPTAEGDELDEDDGEEEEEPRDDTDGEYRPGGGGSTGASASSSSKRRAGARQSEGGGGGSRKRGGRAGASGATGLERRATTAGGSTSQGERPSKRRKSEADGELEKKFTCPHPSCGRAFARNFNLQAHIKSHQGIREFKCPECFKLFSRKHDCTRHCISIHNYDKDGTAPPERQPVYVAQKVLPVNVMVERAQERQRAAVGTGDKGTSDEYPPRNGTAAPLFSGRPLAVKRDTGDERSPLLSHAPFVPPHPAYGSQYRANQDNSRDASAYGSYASTSTEQLPPQAAPPPSLSFDHPSMQPAAGSGQQQPQQQQPEE